MPKVKKPWPQLPQALWSQFNWRQPYCGKNRYFRTAGKPEKTVDLQYMRRGCFRPWSDMQRVWAEKGIGQSEVEGFKQLLFQNSVVCKQLIVSFGRETIQSPTYVTFHSGGCDDFLSYFQLIGNYCFQKKESLFFALTYLKACVFCRKGSLFFIYSSFQISAWVWKSYFLLRWPLENPHLPVLLPG